MNPRQLRALGFGGILTALALSIWHLWRTYQDGQPRWYFLIMSMGILLLLSYQLMSNRRK